jgi:thiol peroxidase
MERKGIVTVRGNPVALIGSEVKIGDKTPDFTVLDGDLKEVRIGDFAGKIKVISVSASLDTPVCDMQARRFNQETTQLPDDVVILNITMDLPFAISRFCTTAGIDKIKALSDHRDASFGNLYGVLIKELRLLARSIFIIDKDGIIRYIEIVPELTNHPNYNKALDFLKKII